MEAARQLAYTGGRPDVIALIPPDIRSLLDCGCSDGALGAAVQRLRPSVRVEGVEFDADLAARAATRLHRVVPGDLNRFDWRDAFGDRTFDCLVMADVLEHVVDPAATLRAALAHLAPGGVVVVSVPNIRHLSAFWAIFVRGQFPRRARGLFDASHLRWFTHTELQSLLQGVGLEIETQSVNLRWGDTGGGRINRLLTRWPVALSALPGVRAFLGYQILVRAKRAQ